MRILRVFVENLGGIAKFKSELYMIKQNIIMINVA